MFLCLSFLFLASGLFVSLVLFSLSFSLYSVSRVLFEVLLILCEHTRTVVQLPPLIVREPPSVVLTSQRKSHVDLRCDAQGSPQPV